MQRVKNLGINIGEKIKVISKQPLGPITIEVKNTKVAVGRGMAYKIYVTNE